MCVSTGLDYLRIVCRWLGRALVPSIMISGCASTSIVAPEASPDLELFDLTQYESVQDRDGQDPSLTVVVAISGGGFRAANLGVGALLAMEAIELEINGRKTNLLKEVDYFTTVSGGGFAPGLYIQGLLSTPPHLRKDFRFLSHLKRYEAGQRIPSDRLESVQRTLFWRLLGYAIQPGVIATDLDRGDKLQDRLDQTVLKRAKCNSISAPPDSCSWTLDDVFKHHGEGEPTTPYWIANATNYTNGEIFSFTPDNLCSRGVEYYRHKNAVHPTNCGLRGDSGYSRKPLASGVPLALGMRTSGNFPIGIPTTTLERRDGNIKLSDGGQADNLAFYSALEILYQDVSLASLAPNNGGLPEHRRILVLVDAFRGSLGTAEETTGSPNIGEVALRSPSLPMDALRSRIRQSLRQLSVERRSEVDSVLLESNLAVAYINIDKEPEARKVGTTFWLEEEAQNALIEAGFRQTYATMTGECASQYVLAEIGVTVDCTSSGLHGQIAGGSIVSELGMIEFNSGLLKRRKEDVQSIRARSLSGLSTSLVDLQTALEAELLVGRAREMLRMQREEMAEQVSEADSLRRKRALWQATAMLNKRGASARAANTYQTLFEEAMRQPNLAPEKLESARVLACWSNHVHRSSKLAPLIQPLKTTTCREIEQLGRFESYEKAMLGMPAEAEEIARGCRRSWPDYIDICIHADDVASAFRSALSAYTTELSAPTSELTVGGSREVHREDATCTRAVEIGHMATALRVASQISVNSIDKAALDDVHRGILTKLESIPRTSSDLRLGCSQLESSKSTTVSLNKMIDDVSRASDHVRCVLSVYANEMDASPRRFATTAQVLLTKPTNGELCGEAVTSVPARRFEAAQARVAGE